MIFKHKVGLRAFSDFLARAHRIGQEKEVKIYRLLTKNTREKEMFEAASRKLGLDKAVLSQTTVDFQQSKRRPSLDKESLEVLLKHGAYAMLHAETEEDEKMLLEGDLDQLLARNATVMRWDEKVAPISKFSKASFTLPGAEGESLVDLHDKDFWDKILPQQSAKSLKQVFCISCQP